MNFFIVTNIKNIRTIGLFFWILFSSTQTLAISLSDFHTETISNKCPVATWNITHKTCRNPACGQEQYDSQTRQRREEHDGTSCPGFHTNAECTPLIQPGEVMGSCSHTCNVKSQDFRVYWEAIHTGTFSKMRDKECSNPACGEESRTAATFSKCRHLDHEIDDARIVEAMNTGKRIDRSAALLAKAINETPTLPNTVRTIIFELVAGVTNDSPANEAKIDALRALILKHGAAISEQDARTAWEHSQPPVSILKTNPETDIDQNSTFSISELKVSAPISIVKPMAILAHVTVADANKTAGHSITTTAASWDYSGYTVGYGVNSVTGNSKGSCIKASPNQPDSQGGTSKVVRYSLDKIDDYQSLLRSLFASASFSVTAGFGGANASAQFSQTFQASEQSIYLLAKVDVSLEELSYSFDDLKLDWKKIQNSGLTGRKRFYDGCGDRYVRGMKKGANFVALYQLMARDENEKQSLQASFSGGTATGSFSGSAQFISALDRVHHFTNVHVKILSLGYPGGAIPDSANGIIKYASEFPDKVSTSNAYPVTATTGEYSDFPSFETGTPMLDSRQREFLNQADIDFEWLQSRRAIINYVKSEPKLFAWGTKSKKDLLTSERNLIRLMDTLSERAATCFGNQNKCTGYQPIDRSMIWLPAILPKPITKGGCSENLLGDLKKRFGNYNGGCLDTSTGWTWSSPSTSYWTFEEADTYCKSLLENQTRGWVLPSMFETDTLKSPDGGAEGFKYGAYLNDWFWTHNAESPRKGVRVNINSGTRKDGEPTLLKFRVICRQG